MRFVGIDPGLATIGIGVIESDRPGDLHGADWLTITTPAGMPLGTRLQEIAQDLRHFLAETKPDLIVIEKLYFATNEKTAIDVAHARGVILLAAADMHVPILEPTPLQLKQGITSDGGADKVQMQTMLVHILGLTEIPKPDDAADALALAVYGALQQQTMGLVK